MFSNEACILPFSCREDAGFVLSRIFCGGTRVLIVYGGKSAVRSGVLDRAEKSLAEAGISSWARYVYKDCLPRFVRFARNVMGVTADGTDEEIALKGIDAMVDFYHSIGMPASFHELGIFLSFVYFILLSWQRSGKEIEKKQEYLLEFSFIFVSQPV